MLQPRRFPNPTLNVRMYNLAGLYKLSSVVTHSLKPPGFNPRAYAVISWFQSLRFLLQLVPLQPGAGDALGVAVEHGAAGGWDGAATASWRRRRGGGRSRSSSRSRSHRRSRDSRG
jgi:hypothetical protein